MSESVPDPREPKDHRLFHYTRKPEHLEDMLRNGLWPRYCEEDFEWLVGEPVIIAFPMLCFCDIPLDASDAHRARYGDYALGFSKNWLEKFDINPLWYVQPESTVGKSLSANLRMKHRFDLAKVQGNPLRDILPFMKPTIGDQPDRTAARKGTMEIFACDEEMEWRHTPAALADKWFQSCERGFVDEGYHALSAEYRIKIHPDEIDCVFVPKHDDACDLMKKFPEIQGKIRQW